MDAPRKTNLFVCIVVLLISATAGFLEIRKTSHAIKTAISGLPTGSSSRIAPRRLASPGIDPGLAVLVLATERLEALTDATEVLVALREPYEVLHAAAAEVDRRWLGWIYGSEVKERVLQPQIDALDGILVAFASSPYDGVKLGLKLYRGGPGMVVKKIPRVKGMKQFGYRNVTALERSLFAYRRDVISYTVFKVVLLTIVSALVVYGASRLMGTHQQRAQPDT